MAAQEAIWHVVIDGQEQGPLTKAQVLEYLRDGMLAGNDLVWRPGFPGWKPVSEMREFWQPPKQTSIRASVQSQTPLHSTPESARRPDRTDAPIVGHRWSLWKS